MLYNRTVRMENIVYETRSSLRAMNNQRPREKSNPFSPGQIIDHKNILGIF